MTTLVRWPLQNCRMDRKENVFEPPINTDEHRLKADKAKAHFLYFPPFFIMQLSVFIGVHRWLKSFCSDLLDLNSSVDVFVGACDASVSS